MRKLLALLLVMGLAVFSSSVVYAQQSTGDGQTEVLLAQASSDQAADSSDAAAGSGFQLLKKYFIDGDWRFMSFVLVCLILGLAFCIERIITLNIATTNTDKLLARIDENLKNGDMEGAMEVCKSTQGPTASIL